jgi:hypothetical protein
LFAVVSACLSSSFCCCTWLVNHPASHRLPIALLLIDATLRYALHHGLIGSPAPQPLQRRLRWLQLAPQQKVGMAPPLSIAMATIHEHSLRLQLAPHPLERRLRWLQLAPQQRAGIAPPLPIAMATAPAVAFGAAQRTFLQRLLRRLQLPPQQLDAAGALWRPMCQPSY